MPAVSITINGDNGAEAAMHMHDFVRHTIGNFLGGAPKPAPAPTADIQNETLPEVASPAPVDTGSAAATAEPVSAPKAKPGRKKQPETIEGTATEVTDLTIEQTREKAREIAAAPGGTAALTDALKSFGVGKMSELPAKGVLYSAFIAKIEELVKVAS